MINRKATPVTEAQNEATMPKGASLPQIVETINAHVEYLSDHIAYIDEIKGKDKRKIEDYCRSTFGFKTTLSELFLLDLKNAITAKIEIYQELKDLLKILENAEEHPEREVHKTISILKLSLSYIYVFDKFTMMLTSPGLNETMCKRISNILGDISIIPYIQNTLNQYSAPEKFNEISKIITIEERKSMLPLIVIDWDKYQDDKQNKFRSLIIDRMGEQKLKAMLKVKTNKVSQQNTQSPQPLEAQQQSKDAHPNAQPINSPDTAFNVEFSKASTEFDAARNLINNHRIELRKNPPKNHMDWINLFKKTINTYYDVATYYNNCLEFVDYLTKMDKFNNDIFKQDKQLSDRLNTSVKMISTLENLANHNKIKGKTDELLQELKQLKDKATSIFAEWRNSLPNKEVDFTPSTIEHTQAMHEVLFQDVCDEATQLDKQLQRIKTTLREILNADENEKKIKSEQETLKQKLEEDKEKKILEEKKLEREKFLADKKAKSLEYHRENKQIKELTEKDRLNKDINNNNQAKPKEPTVVNFINPEMAALILKWKDQDKEPYRLLENIVNENIGVKYNDVVNLISKLGGKVIVNIGNGTSHKRLILGKLIKEIHINEDELLESSVKQDKKSKNSNKKNNKHKKKGSAEDKSLELANANNANLATHGFFKQHSAGHTDRVLCRFNLHLVNELFNKAGITLEYLTMLDEKRNLQP